MPVYKAEILGRRTPLILKAESAAKAKDQLVTVDSLTADEMDAAIEAGAVRWKPGEELPADAPEAKAEAKAEVPEEPDPADPANYAPGGPLHGQTKPASVIAAEQAASAQKPGGRGKAAGDSES